MPYRIRIAPFVLHQMAEWKLSEFVRVDALMRVGEVLPDRPWARLLPAPEPGGGMIFPFDLIDPENRMWRHVFVYRVYYGQDEETLHVASGIYRREFGT